MTHFKAELDPFACIYGDKLEGTRNKSTPPKLETIAIKGFYCGVKICGDTQCAEVAHRLYRVYGLQLHGNQDDSMSGKRGFIEPASGYKGPGFITAKSPPKGAKHNPIFSVEKVNSYPAICYSDSFQTNQVKLARVERAQIIRRR